MPTLTRPRCRVCLAVLLSAGFFGHVLYLTLRPALGLAGDEAHYWDWSRELDWSYYSKGPLVAVLIRGGTTLFGDTPLGVRFFALVLAAGTSGCTYWLTRRVFGSERLALGAVALTHAVPVFVAGSLLMTIDSPYYFCWAMATCFGYLAAVEGRRWAWPAAGACVGLGFLAKYAALLWLVNVLIYLALADRRRLRTAGPWAACAVALVFTTPVIAWNARHDWVTFGHVARSTTEDQTGFNPLRVLAHFGELVGGQVGLLNPVVFGFLVGGVWTAGRAWRGRSNTLDAAAEAADPVGPPEDASSRAESAPFAAASRRPPAPGPAVPTPSRMALAYLLAIGLPFFAYVSLVTLRKNAEPNWPVAAYFSLMPLAAWFVARSWPAAKGWLVAAVAIGVLAMAVFHEPGPLLRVKPLRAAAARVVGYDGVGRRVAAERDALGPDALVLCDKYQTAGLMAFYVTGHPTTYCVGSYLTDPKQRDRLTQYDLWPDRDLSQPRLRGRNAVYVGRVSRDVAAAFDRVRRLPDEPVVYRGVTLRTQTLWACYGFRGMARPDDGMTKR